MEDLMGAFAAALVGLANGQAIDLLWGRFYTGQEIRRPISRCANCGAASSPLLLAPFVAGFVWKDRRCPNCGEALSLRSAVLPVAGALLYLISYAVFDDSFGAALLGGFFATLFFTLTLTDLETRLLPNRIVYPGILLAILLSWGWPDTSVVEILFGGLAGVLLASAMLAFSLPFGRDAFGMGDVKMIVLMGFVLGVPSVFVGVVLGTFVAGAGAALLLATRLRSRRDYIPHGPFLALGAIVALFWGHDLWPY
jgi:prepilin signal peptidase PulO-like enzyme (type II secretory pathway)